MGLGYRFLGFVLLVSVQCDEACGRGRRDNVLVLEFGKGLGGWVVDNGLVLIVSGRLNWRYCVCFTCFLAARLYQADY